MVDTSKLPPGIGNLAEGRQGSWLSTDKPVTELGYHNPSPLMWLLGLANEATGVVEGMDLMAMVETGSEVSTLTKGLNSEF